MKRILVVLMVVSSIVFSQMPSSASQTGIYEVTQQAKTGEQIEPNAGSWRTWVISSGEDYRVPPPPNPAETQAELQSLDELISQNDAQIKQQIAFWDAGAPAYRWIDLINSRLLAGTPTTAFPHRVYTYVALAMYDGRLQHGNRSTTTTGRAQASWTTNCQLHYRSLTARPIHLSMLRRPRRRRLCSLIFCRQKRRRFKLWLSRPAGLVCLPAFNTRATTTPDSLSAGELESRS